MHFRKRIAGLLAVTAAAGLAGAGLAAPAHAGTSQADVVNVHIRSQISQKCVAIGGGSTAVVQAIQYTCSGGTEQQWDQEFLGFDVYDNPIYVFHNIASAKCLTADGGSGGAVTQRACDGSARQRWSQDGKSRLHNNGSGTCFAVPGGSQAQSARLIHWTCGNGAEQKWTIY
ncbi:RICIN domain-containing protein [Kribbella sp. NPDC056861]|uniref:RICIN domain-containing protein n=1 Tax=Kribbella sp. NPDC056861 TaxID=3154857 RepID=UPI00343BE221